MKSRAYPAYAVLVIAALAIWFVQRSTRKPETSPVAPPVAGSTSATVSRGGPAPDTGGITSPGSAGTPGFAPATGAVAASSGAATKPPGASRGPDANAGVADGSSGQAAQIDVGRVRHMISDYHTLMGENPVGTNAEIMKLMMGGNSHQATLGPPDGLSLNGQGELVDQWGTPYFFHQLSRDKMEVRSAGPDRIMWTADDIVAR